MSEESLPMYEVVDRPFCVECTQYFTAVPENDGTIVVLRCACQRERVFTAGQWVFLEEVGSGIGMTAVIYNLVKFDGVGTKFQMIDQFVLENFGDRSECDKPRAVEIVKELIAKKVI